LFGFFCFNPPPPEKKKKKKNKKNTFGCLTHPPPKPQRVHKRRKNPQPPNPKDEKNVAKSVWFFLNLTLSKTFPNKNSLFGKTKPPP